MSSQKLQKELAYKDSGSFEWTMKIHDDYIDLGASVESVLGYPAEHFENKLSKYTKLIPQEYRHISYEARMASRENAMDVYSVEYPMRTASGKLKWFLVRGKFIDDSKETACGVAIDIDDSKQHTERLSSLAYKDSLTGLGNMRYIIDGLVAAKGVGFESLGGILYDIKDFKSVNEIFGFEFGDELLAAAAAQLRNIYPEIPIVRVSGDRFLLIFENVTEHELSEYATSLLDASKRTLTVQGQHITMDIHIGIAVIDEADAVKLLSDTETALYFAKKNTAEGGSFCVLNDILRASYFNQTKMKSDLRKAVAEKEFEMYYQPVVDVSIGKITSCEALIRWNHPQKGVIQPLEFIRFAEETGLIIPIGEFVIDEAASQIRRWHDAGLDLVVSINLSPRQFFSPQLPMHIKDAIDKYHIPPHKLVIEVTESVMISDFANIRLILDELCSYGVDVALDDFGTGYSSLSYLGKMPLDYIKIDRSFVVNAALNESDHSILNAIVNLSLALGYDIIAEGVENETQMKTLEGLGCMNMQGYLFSRPLPSKTFEAFVRDFKM